VFEKIKGWLRDKFSGKKPKGGRMIGISVGVGGVAGVKSVGRLGAEATPVTSQAPNTPTIYGGTITETTWNLSSSAFSDPDQGDTHLNSDWQVTTAADTGFASVVWQSLANATNKTSIQATGLTGSTAYIARKRDRDGQGNASAYSSTVADTTAASGGVSPFFEDDFEAQILEGPPIGSGNGFEWGESTSTRIKDVFPYSGTKSLRFAYEGNVDPAAYAMAEQKFNLPDLQEWWFEYYILVPSNYVHRDSTSSDNNKFFWFSDVNEGGEYHVKMMMEGNLGSGDNLTIARPMWGTNAALGGQTVSGNGMAATETLIHTNDINTWMHMKYHLKISDTDSSNGIFKIWKNGGVLQNETGLANDPVDGVTNTVDRGYLMGWSNSGFAENTRFYIDDIKFYDTDPGW